MGQSESQHPLRKDKATKSEKRKKLLFGDR